MSSKKQRSKEMTTKTNNETPEALSHIKRAHGIYFTSKVLLGWIIKLYFNFRSKVYRPKNKSFILISNHTTMFDPFFEALSFKPYLRFVTSDHLLRMGAWGKFIKFCVNPIPKRRGADSEKTMEMMAESVRNGVSVCIHAEGYCSINGETGFVFAAHRSACQGQRCRPYHVPHRRRLFQGPEMGKALAPRQNARQRGPRIHARGASKNVR